MFVFSPTIKVAFLSLCEISPKYGVFVNLLMSETPVILLLTWFLTKTKVKGRKIPKIKAPIYIEVLLGLTG